MALDLKGMCRMRDTEIKEELKRKQKTYYKIRDEISRLEDKIFKEEQLPKMKEYVGRCFKFRNSLGDDNQWGLYIKVIGIKGTGFLIAQYQKDYRGVVQITPSETTYYNSREWLFEIPITLKQFNAEINKGIKYLEKIKDMPL